MDLHDDIDDLHGKNCDLQDKVNELTDDGQS